MRILLQLEHRFYFALLVTIADPESRLIVQQEPLGSTICWHLPLALVHVSPAIIAPLGRWLHSYARKGLIALMGSRNCSVLLVPMALSKAYETGNAVGNATKDTFVQKEVAPQESKYVQEVWNACLC